MNKVNKNQYIVKVASILTIFILIGGFQQVKVSQTILDHMVTAGFTLTSREMAALADNLWFARNSRQSDSKHHPVAAAVPENVKELEEAVAALNVRPKRHQPKKKAAKGGKGTVCHMHKKYGAETWKCADPTYMHVDRKLGLEGRSFHVLTDHKQLVFALHRARNAWSARQGHHLAYVAEFTSDL